MFSWPHGEKIIFLDFSGFSTQIEGGQNTVSTGATYQRMATTLLRDMMHNEVEVYVDDMIVKSKDREGHIANLRKFFERIKEYRLRLNPQKCTFG